MKKSIILLTSFILFVITTKAQVYKTIDCTAGNLITLLSDEEIETVTNLVVTGTMDARDFNTLRVMGRDKALRVLDLTAVTVAAYTGTEGTGLFTTVYLANEIPEYAFSFCSALTSITIPNSVTSIGISAFYNCAALTSITIPNSVTSVGDWAFYNCAALTSILVDAGNIYYSSLDGVLFNKTKTELIQYPNGKTGAYAIPNSVTSISIGAFCNCAALTSITIPNSVTSIGAGAFENCDALNLITILSNELLINDYAFAYCENLAVIKVYTAPENLIASVDAFDEPLTTIGTLYVPKGMKGSYELSVSWNTIANIAEYSTTSTLSTSVRITIPANANNSISMDIASNSNWTANSTTGWLTVNPASGYGNGSVTITAAQNNSSSPRTATISVSGNGLSPQNLIITQEFGTTGKATIENPYISIFPNPADLVLHISGFEDDATVKIFDLNGKTVISQLLLGGEVNISYLSNGVYNIQVSDINGVFSDKFVKN